MDVISKFKARAESGRIVTILHIQDPGPIHRPVTGPPRHLKGTTHFQLEAGQHVNRINDAVYEIIYGNSGSERVTRIE